MNIPIVFSFNDGFITPAGVCLSSLLRQAHKNTFYSIYILFSENRLSQENRSKFKKLEDEFQNCTIEFLNVKNAFSDAYVTRHISVDTYYRLLIPKLLPQYDKIIYCDVDILFRGDLTTFYLTDLKDKPLGAVVTLKKSRKINKNNEIKKGHYFNAGVLLLDLTKIKQIEDFNERVEELTKQKFDFHDQDILNIIFKDKVSYLSEKYNFTRSALSNERTNEFLEICKDPIIMHYAGGKPWSGLISIRVDDWWEEFCLSSFYSDKFYQKYFESYQHLELIWQENRLLKKMGMHQVFLKLKKLITSFRK